MANATIQNPTTFNAAGVFNTTLTAPALIISNINNNIFVGATLPSSVGSNNVGIGNNFLPNLVSGTGNVACGQQALLSVSSGVDNVGIGRQSGVNAGTAIRCSFLGPQTGFEAFAGPFTDSTAVGSGAALNANNQIMMGRSSETVVFPGNATFYNLPISTATPTMGNQFTTKSFTDSMYVLLSGKIPVTYTGTLLNALTDSYTLGNYNINGTSYSNIYLNGWGNNLRTPESGLLTIDYGSAVFMGGFSGTVPNVTSFVGASLRFCIGNFAGTFSILTTFSFPLLELISASISAIYNGLTTFSLPALTWCANISITSSTLTTIDLPVIVTCGNFAVAAATVTTINVPNLINALSFSGGTYTGLTTLNMGNLQTTVQFIQVYPALVTCDLHSLTTVNYGGPNTFSLTVASATSVLLTSFQSCLPFTLVANVLTTFSLPAIVSVGSTFVITAPNLVTFSLGSTLKNIGGNFTMSGMKLNQASVDGILVSLAALDGTNGTTAYSSKTVLLNGGTSSTPSATGLSAKATLVARGCTITTN